MAKAQKKARGRAEEKLRAFHEEEEIKSSYDVALLKRLWPFVRPHSGFLVASFFTLLAIAGQKLIRPLVAGQVVESATARSSEGLFRHGVVLVVLLLGSQALTFAHVYLMQVAGARAMGDLREHVFVFFSRLQLRFFDRTPVGRLVTRASSDVDQVGELFASGVLSAMGDLIALVGIVAMMLILDYRLALIAFATLPVVGLLVNTMRKRTRKAYRDIRAKTARLNAFLNEQVNGIAVVQAYGREDAATSEFDEINESYRDANKRSIFYEAVLDAAIEMVGTVCIASVLWWTGVHGAGAHVVTFATVVTFTQYIREFFEPISTLSQRYTLLQAAMAGAERIFQLLDEKQIDEPDAKEGECAPEGPDEEAICLDAVDFAYKPGVPVLHTVSLSARRGERVALVGATGAGKSTVASLLLRLYDVQEGFVRVLGKDVRSYSRRDLRELFSVVPQDVFLFSGTVLSNVAMSDAVPDRERAKRALATVGASEMFRRRGDGESSATETANVSNGASDDAWLDARVDERGANFSVGERQLLAFARAVYRDAPLLVLDEATASVDSDTESRLQVALDAVMRGRTSIVIAHRLSTIQAADRIIVFHKGRVVENGSHAELLALEGVYARLYRMQFARERAAEIEGALEASNPPAPVAPAAPAGTAA